jgi:acetyl-CoA acyltransferase 2
MHPEFAMVRAGALIVAVKGCDLTIMGIGPVEAIRQAVQKAKSTFLDQMDRIEINEDMSKTNLHGGAISLGHALRASGSRILAHLAHELAGFPDHK